MRRFRTRDTAKHSPQGPHLADETTHRSAPGMNPGSKACVETVPNASNRQPSRASGDTSYPEQLMVKETIDEQGVYVGTWVLNAFTTLLKSQSPH